MAASQVRFLVRMVIRQLCQGYVYWLRHLHRRTIQPTIHDWSCQNAFAAQWAVQRRLQRSTLR